MYINSVRCLIVSYNNKIQYTKLLIGKILCTSFSYKVTYGHLLTFGIVVYHIDDYFKLLRYWLVHT